MKVFAPTFVKKLLTLHFLFFLLCTVGYAQQPPRAAFVVETDSIIVANNGDLVPRTIKIKNNTNTPFNGKLTLQNGKGVTLIGQAASAIELAANAQKFIPVRLQIGNSVPAGQSTLHFQLTDTAQVVKAEVKSTLTVQSKKHVQLSVPNPNQLMQNVGDSIQVAIMLANKGNSQETITLTAAFPDLRGGKKVEKRQVALGAFQDTIVSFNRIITRALLRLERYTVNVAALYANGELINNVLVNIQNVSGSRTYVDPSQRYIPSAYSTNFIELRGNNLFSQNESFQLDAQNEFEVMGGKLDVSLDAYQYTHGGSRPLISNTYIDYQKNGIGVTVGNISESLETFVNGRGVKAYLENEQSTQRVEVGWVDKTYNLLGNQYAAKNGYGYTTYAMTQLATKNEGEYSANLIYDRDPLTNSENIIAMNDYSFLLKENIRLGFDLGGGLTRLLRNGEDATFEPSMAIGGNLSGRWGNYSLMSHNFYSTGYYPGVRRGVLQLNQRVSRRIKQTNLWLGFSMYQYNPKHLEAYYAYYSSNNSSVRYEAGINFPIARFTSMSFSAKKHTDKGRIGFSASDVSQSKLHAFRLAESINWRSSNSLHGINLSAENGFSEAPFTDKRKLQLRLNGSYNYRFIHISSYFQKGDFTVMEAYRNAVEENDNYRLNVSGAVRKDFLNRKLNTRLNVSYHRDSYSGSGYSTSARVEYEVFPQFTCFTNIYLYSYKNAHQTTFNSNLQAGLRYNLPASDQEKRGKQGNLNLFLFYDNNLNGVYDEGDTPAEDRIVSIGEVSFISNSKGRVQYKKMPYGQYSLRVPSEDWVAIIPASVQINQKRTTIDVPLQRTGKVSGKLYYQYDARTSEQFDKKYGGLRLWATASNGKQIEALTNANGEFTLFLPIGEYVISVDANSLPQNVYTTFEPQTVTVAPDQTVKIPAIELKIKQRKIEIKRFGD